MSSHKIYSVLSKVAARCGLIHWDVRAIVYASSEMVSEFQHLWVFPLVGFLSHDWIWYQFPIEHAGHDPVLYLSATRKSMSFREKLPRRQLKHVWNWWNARFELFCERDGLRKTQMRVWFEKSIEFLSRTLRYNAELLKNWISSAMLWKWPLLCSRGGKSHLRRKSRHLQIEYPASRARSCWYVLDGPADTLWPRDVTVGS